MLSSRPGILTRRATEIASPLSNTPRRPRRRASAPRASYGGGDRPPVPPPPPPPPPLPEKSNAPVVYEEPPPPPPPPLPRFVTGMPTSRRNAIGASLLFVSALFGFSNAFFKDNNEDDFFGPQGGLGPRPYRIVAGRVFVRTSSGDVLSVNRIPRDFPDSDRTLMLLGEQGLFLLRLTKEAMAKVDLHSGAPLEEEDEFLTRVFATGDWESAAVAVTPSKQEMRRYYEENGIDEEALEREDDKEGEMELEEAIAEVEADEEMNGGAEGGTGAEE